MNFDFPGRTEAAARRGAAVPDRALPDQRAVPHPGRLRALLIVRSGRRWRRGLGSGAAIPEEYGGAGLGHLAICVLAEELGHAVAPSAVRLVCLHRDRGDQAVRQRRTREAAVPAEAGRRRGDRHIRDGRASRARGSAQADRPCRRREGPSGTKLAVPDGDVADFAVVAVHGGNAPWLHLVDLNGLVSRAKRWQPSIPRGHTARIAFDDRRGRTAARQRRGGCGPSARSRGGHAGVRAGRLRAGGAGDGSASYARERYAFGRPIVRSRRSSTSWRTSTSRSSWRAPTLTPWRGAAQ